MTSSPPAYLSSSKTKPVLITGGAGFVGSNLALRLAREGKKVLVLDSLSRPGVEQNAEELRRAEPRNIAIQIIDVRDESAAMAVREASAVVHFAAQVAVTTSLEQPLADFDVNLRGTLNLLEAARRCSHPPTFLFASTNKVYGDLSDVALEPTREAYRPADLGLRRSGIDESRPLSFHTPYGCSKGAADQYVLDYARSFGIAAASFRMSCIYGPRQLGTEDQGWVAHFLIRALHAQPITIFGDGRQVRDVMFVDDATEVYASALEKPQVVAGKAFNVGGGPDNAVSLLQVLQYIGILLGERLDVRYAPWRAGDQRYYVSDTAKLRAHLALKPATHWQTGIARLAKWLSAGRQISQPDGNLAVGEAR